jgi:hypothetical protein
MLLLKFVQIQKNHKRKATFRTVLRQCCEVFCGNLLICDLRINHDNFGFAVWHTYEILRICDSGMSLRIEFSDLRLRILKINLLVHL